MLSPKIIFRHEPADVARKSELTDANTVPKVFYLSMSLNHRESIHDGLRKHAMKTSKMSL